MNHKLWHYFLLGLCGLVAFALEALTAFLPLGHHYPLAFEIERVAAEMLATKHGLDGAALRP